MSKKQDRYKEDYSHIDLDQLDEIETKKFEKFHSKKKSKPNAKQKQGSKIEEDQ